MVVVDDLGLDQTEERRRPGRLGARRQDAAGDFDGVQRRLVVELDGRPTPGVRLVDDLHEALTHEAGVLTGVVRDLPPRVLVRAVGVEGSGDLGSLGVGEHGVVHGVGALGPQNLGQQAGIGDERLVDLDAVVEPEQAQDPVAAGFVSLEDVRLVGPVGVLVTGAGPAREVRQARE